MSGLEIVVFGVAVGVALVLIGALFFAFLRSGRPAHPPDRIPGRVVYDEQLSEDSAPGRRGAEVDSDP